MGKPSCRGRFACGDAKGVTGVKACKLARRAAFSAMAVAEAGLPPGTLYVRWQVGLVCDLICIVFPE